MNRSPYSSSRPASLLVEALEPRIAPAGVLNESKFTSVVVGGTVLLDASGGTNDFQGLTTGSGAASGSYLLYITAGKALVFTTDINGNGRLDPGEITGIAASTDTQGRPLNLTLFSDIHGDIVTNLVAGHGVSNLTDSDNNPNNGNDGQILNNIGIGSITLRTLTTGDIDTTIPGNTVNNRIALTSFSIFGNVVTGGDMGSLTIDKSGEVNLSTKFSGVTGTQLYRGSTPSINGIFTGTAANNLAFHFTQNTPFALADGTSQGNNVQGHIVPFNAPAGGHGGDILNISANVGTTYSIATLASGNGGFGARGGNINNVTYNGHVGSFSIVAGDGGQGATGGQGGSITQFVDLSTVTGQATLHTGTGGVGLLGAGGAGGTISFGTANISADFRVILGNGGSGFTSGGNGAGLAAAVLTGPESTFPLGNKFIGTWHDIGDVGNTHPLGTNANGQVLYRPETIDFNGDGFSDAVFTTSTPDQVVVVFGSSQSDILIDNNGDFGSGIPNARIVLNAAGVANPVVTIGDFNGDGRPDIAVASGAATNFGGVYVFLNQIGTKLDPVNSLNFSGNPLGDHPFSPAMQSATPSLPDRFFQTSGAITALASGDYNGDGIADIAYVQQVTEFVTLKVDQVAGVLFGSPQGAATAHDPTTGRIVGSGYFFANPAAPRQGALLQFAAFANADVTNLKATSTNSNNLPDPVTGLPAAAEIFIYGKQTDRSLVALAVPLSTVTPHVPSVALLTATPLGLGQVDTNRLLSAGTTNQVSLVDATLQDFAIQDVNSDGSADVIALTKTPSFFLVNFPGNGMGGFTAGSNLPNPPVTGDNNGVFLGVGFMQPPPTTALATVDANADGIFNEVVFLQFPPGPPVLPTLNQATLQTAAGTPSFYGDNGQVVYQTSFVERFITSDQTVTGLDAYYSQAATAANPHPAAGYGLISPDTSDYRLTGLFLFSALNPFGVRYNLTENTFFLQAGNGGSSTAGPGGNGGTLGSTLTAGLGGAANGSLAITFPGYPAFAGQAYVSSGSGGNGFGGGGSGGDVVGVSVRYSLAATILTSNATLFTGNGGNGISGDGGRGGNLSEFSILGGIATSFTAGNGGSGLHGGAGGSVLGNNEGFFDSSAVSTTITAGIGGQGALGGGAGGNVNSIDAVFLPVIGGSGGSLQYTAGNGGSAAGGGGGAGGNINDSSPDVVTNNLGGPGTILSLITGVGGNGLTGGSGGGITNFINQPTDSIAVPGVLTVLTGNGGIGVAGVGGSGGNITNFRSSATGLIATLDGSLAGLARVIAGDGGASFGGQGGNGGTVSSSTAQATSTPIVVAGGAGGGGLTAGGTGGSVLGSTINSAAQLIGKVLIVGGAGGDTFAALPSDIVINGDPDTNDLAHAILAFGGVSGRGGNGGNITNIIQPVSTQTAVDLIGGNGGSTLNYGNVLSPTTNVGVGGSIGNVNLAGTVGAINRNTNLGAVTNPPITAYTDPTTGLENISGFVDYLGTAFGGNFVFNDAAGNVGVVAGVAGHVKAVNGVPQAARDGVNGSVVSLTASSIMSIVAGSVNQVAPVQTLSNITVTNLGAVLGADKSPNAPFGPNGQIDYINPLTGQVVTNLQAGFKLIDGAIFAISKDPNITGPRVFSPSST